MTDRRITVAARCLQIDRRTAEVVTALRTASVEPLLLKGPVTARWLYADALRTRPYADADLLVAPSDWDATRSVLAAIGFRCEVPVMLKAPLAKRRHGENWHRSADNGLVDLHWCIHNTEHLDHQLVWTVLSRASDRMEVAGIEVRVPSEPARTLHVVLHLEHFDHPGTQPWTDLERAIEQVRPEVWVQAAALATELGVRSEMGTILARLPEGRQVAERLGLPTDSPEVKARLQREGERSVARRIVWSVFPPPAYVRMGWPFARRGPLFLASAYVWRLLIIPWRPVLWWRTRQATQER